MSGEVGYTHLEANGYHHRVTPLRGDHALASELLPRVHRVVSLLKRWLLGTHHGGVSRAHLDAYLDEFTFRFNRRHLSQVDRQNPGISRIKTFDRPHRIHPRADASAALLR